MKTTNVRVRLLLGPAGSGKTYRCLEQIRRELNASTEDPPLLLVAPKQTTYQLERQLLSSPGLAGYTRLRIVSFDRLAHFIFDSLQQPTPRLLNEEGRIMVLRGLLAKGRDGLKLFRASARLTGFAQELSEALSELQAQQLTPEDLAQLAGRLQITGGLQLKLQDFAALLKDYLDWLRARDLYDADCLIPAATRVLNGRRLPIEGLWVDGFAEWSAQELDLLAELVPHCKNTTLTFCLDRVPAEKISWLAHWSIVRETFADVRSRLERIAGAEVVVELLSRSVERSRFCRVPALAHLEQFWDAPRPFRSEAREAAEIAPTRTGAVVTGPPSPSVQLEWFWPGQEEKAQARPGKKGLQVERVAVGKRTLAASLLKDPSPAGVSEPAGVAFSISAPAAALDAAQPSASLDQDQPRIVVCPDPEAEVTFAAREILRHVRAGGRFRDASVLVRQLPLYHEQLQRVFSHYEIPFFLDRRESVSHHPLAELTRSALRTVVFQWKHEEWFSALKSGLVPVADHAIDRLENEALARGWNGVAWHAPVQIKTTARSAAEQEELRQLESSLEALRQQIMPPFERLALALSAGQLKPAGPQLAAAIRAFWQSLAVEDTLRQWAEAERSREDYFLPNSVHLTVWAQMNAWLENLELAFPTETLSLREWLPILESGLGNLTVGLIPPALDQVLIGSVDRLRSPEVKLALILGMNEGVFPAPPESTVLLTEADRAELEKNRVFLRTTRRRKLGRERYLGYVACTRPSEQLILTMAQLDANGGPLNPSPFLPLLQRLFPAVPIEHFSKPVDWVNAEHTTELIAPLLIAWTSDAAGGAGAAMVPMLRLTELPALKSALEQVKHFRNPKMEDPLTPALAEQLYSPVLRTSVSRLEQFAACPFRFFVNSGLRAEERKLFELDVKEQGSFQHDVLALFHKQLQREGKRWRDITPPEARERVGNIAAGLMAVYREGLLQASDETRFTARVLTDSLKDFVEILTGWIRDQYRFDPIEVELPFGFPDSSPPWQIDLGSGHQLALQGRIDRVDVCRIPGSEDALCVVVDYKSSDKKLDPVLIENGLQLQLLAYLNVLRYWPAARATFGIGRLIPAGVFYVNLRGRYSRAPNRVDALTETEKARKLAYRHTGRFDLQVLRLLDLRADAAQGDQFNYRLKSRGEVHKNCRDPLPAAEFLALLDSVETNLKEMGRRIFSGACEVGPYRRGTTSACDQCDYASICRVDPWTHPYRIL